MRGRRIQTKKDLEREAKRRATEGRKDGWITKGRELRVCHLSPMETNIIQGHRTIHNQAEVNRKKSEQGAKRRHAKKSEMKTERYTAGEGGTEPGKDNRREFAEGCESRRNWSWPVLKPGKGHREKPTRMMMSERTVGSERGPESEAK